VNPTYYGPNNSYFVPAFTIFDAHVGYPITKNFSLTGTFRNMLGTNDRAVTLWNDYNIFPQPTLFGSPGLTLGEAYGPRAFILKRRLQDVIRSRR